MRGRRDASGLILASGLRRLRRGAITWLMARKQVLSFISLDRAEAGEEVGAETGEEAGAEARILRRIPCSLFPCQ